MWSSLYNRGEMRVENQTDHGATIRVTNFPSELAAAPASPAGSSAWPN